MHNKDDKLTLFGDFRPNLSCLSVVINLSRILNVDNIQCKILSAGTVMIQMNELPASTNGQECARQNQSQYKRSLRRQLLVNGFPRVNTDICSNLQCINDELNFRLRTTGCERFCTPMEGSENKFKNYFSSCGGSLLCFYCNNTLVAEMW